MLSQFSKIQDFLAKGMKSSNEFPKTWEIVKLTNRRLSAITYHSRSTEPKTMTLLQPLPQAKSGRNATSRTVGQQFQSIVVMLIVSLVLLGGIGSRLFYLQLVQGKTYEALAQNNRIRIIPKQPVRGNIFDRKQRLLATSRLSHSLFVWPTAPQQPYWPKTVAKVSEILNLPEEDIEALVAQADVHSSTLVRIARDLTPAQITAVEEYRAELQGIEIDIEPVRYYPNGELAAHVLGYTGELSPEALEKRQKEGYRLGDIVGQMGIESSFEQQLRGEWGGQQLEVDGSGRVLRLLGEKEAKAGQDVTLTLDLDLQEAAEKALGNRKGAIVALNPQNGEVLAMVSRPTFDPNIFSKRITSETWKTLQGQGNPFVNRSLRGFPPASTFKIVTATAGMESGKYPPNTVLGTSPFISVGGTRFHEWNRAGFGPSGYVKALAWSSNTFFGQIGKGVGGPTLIKWARQYGFGEKTGIELESESAGLIADDQWKQERLNWGWSVGDTVNMSIGQGFTQATLLQVAVMFAVPANGGYKIKPHLLKTSDNTEEWRESLNLKPQTIEKLRQGLREVVVGGTGGAVNIPDAPPVAGKSGTAEAPPGLPHAWFGAFAPYDNPDIVVVAFAEHSGGGGGSVAAPMVRQVLEAHFRSKP